MYPGLCSKPNTPLPCSTRSPRRRVDVQLIRISQRLFCAASRERTVLLLIDRGQPAGDQVVYRRIADLKGLARGLQQPRKRKARKVSQKREDYRLPWRLTAVQAAAWEEVCADERIQRLGDLGKVRIGVVTGANSFFIRSAAEADSLGKAVRSVPIVSRGTWLNGPRSGTTRTSRPSLRSRRGCCCFPEANRSCPWRPKRLCEPPRGNSSTDGAIAFGGRRGTRFAIRRWGTRSSPTWDQGPPRDMVAERRQGYLHERHSPCLAALRRAFSEGIDRCRILDHPLPSLGRAVRP